MESKLKFVPCLALPYSQLDPYKISNIGLEALAFQHHLTLSSLYSAHPLYFTHDQFVQGIAKHLMHSMRISHAL